MHQLSSPQKIDVHLHTNFSDGKGSVEDYARYAVKKGLSLIAITDHSEIILRESEYIMGVKKEDILDRFTSIKKDIDIAQKQFPEIEILFGMELGFRSEWKEVYEEVLAQLPFDYIIGSLHNIGSNGEYGVSGLDTRSTVQILSETELFDLYFSQMEELITWGHFDALGHFDVPKRYGVEVWKTFDPQKYEERIRNIFKTLVQKEKGIEVNGSGIFCPCADTLPGKEILQIAKEEGLKYITIGSDSHRANRVGKNTEKCFHRIKQADFSNLTIWRNRHPCFLPV